MELGRVDLYGREFGIANEQTFGVGVGVDLGAHPQAATRFGIGDEVHDHLMADQRVPTPVHCDEREQAMLDLVPLACARREVTHTNA